MFAFLHVGLLIHSISSANPWAPPVIRIVANEYAFQVPKVAPAGVVTIRLVNTGKEPHFFRIDRLPEGSTLSEFNAARVAMKAFPSRPVASPMIVLPGDSTEMTLDVAPGRYAGVCMYPAPNRTAHADLGMIGEFVVADERTEKDADDRDLAADDTLRIRDDSFSLSSPLLRGTSSLRIENKGKGIHSAYILRIPPGSSVEQEIALFLIAPFNERPNRPLQGLYEIAPEVHAVVRVALDPGDYVLVSRMANMRGSRIEPGLLLPFTVK